MDGFSSVYQDNNLLDKAWDWGIPRIGNLLESGSNNI
jgi:hypothetical protein